MLLPRSLDLPLAAILPPLRPPSMRAAATSLARSAISSPALSLFLPSHSSLPLRPLSFLSTLASPPFRPVCAASSAIEAEPQLHDEGRSVPLESPGHFVEQAAERDMRSFATPEVEVRDLEELPEQWRRARVAWLCKELPAHKPAGLIRVLNAQRKWITQEDATYITLHCMRIRENEAAFRVYKWMIQQHWFRFDFALATKLADFLGKDRKFTKCREMFDAIINQGRVPNESTFHILTIAYLSAPVQGCLEEACSIYNRMIQLGGYKPRLSLHNSLFRALVSKPGGSSNKYLKQAEFIYHNLVTSELEIHKDIYAGLIWLHSYQDVIDRERIATLREEMRGTGVEESRDVLVSIMRAFSKDGDVEETEKAWLKLLESGYDLPSQAFVYRMDLYSEVGEPMKSLDIFKGLKEQETPSGVASYLKIIEVMAKAQEVEIVESLVEELIESGMKPLLPAFLDLMSMYSSLNLHDKLESAFSKCLTKCSPNRSIYTIYLDSLVKIGKIEKAEEIFNEMHGNGAIGTNAKACNTILGGFLSLGEFVKAEKIYDIMCRKKYDIEPHYLEKVEYILSLNRKVVRRPVSLKLDKQQREILTGLLLGGARIESDEERRNHVVHFEFSENSSVHSAFKSHIHQCFYEWLTSSSRSADGDDEIPCRFCTIAHSYFGFFADQFWPKGRPLIPKLIHRWLSPRVLAYWYMYGGLRLTSGDIVLRLNSGSREDVERIVKTFQTKSLACRVKRKGRVCWIGFQGSNAVWFWKLIQPHVLESVKDILTPYGGTTTNGSEEGQPGDLDSESDSDEQSSAES